MTKGEGDRHSTRRVHASAWKVAELKGRYGDAFVSSQVQMPVVPVVVVVVVLVVVVQCACASADDSCNTEEA
jgi:hypothetical protein